MVRALIKNKNLCQSNLFYGLWFFCVLYITHSHLPRVWEAAAHQAQHWVVKNSSSYFNWLREELQEEQRIWISFQRAVETTHKTTSNNQIKERVELKRCTSANCTHCWLVALKFATITIKKNFFEFSYNFWWNQTNYEKTVSVRISDSKTLP